MTSWLGFWAFTTVAWVQSLVESGVGVPAELLASVKLTDGHGCLGAGERRTWLQGREEGERER